MVPMCLQNLEVEAFHEPELRSAAFRPQQRRNFHALGHMVSAPSTGSGVCGLKAALLGSWSQCMRKNEWGLSMNQRDCLGSAPAHIREFLGLQFECAKHQP